MDPVDLYLTVRAREGRLYPNKIVAQLPVVPKGHPLAKEWRLRATSSARLIRYLSRAASPLSIVELGCGNGWLTNRLAHIPRAQVYGLDRNHLELAQAAGLFGQPRLSFLRGEILNPPFSHHSFDVIVLSSVIQYLADLPSALRMLQAFLKQDGEIHILDSPLYRPDELPVARQRTRAYYESLGFPEMFSHYFHHPINCLDDFTPRWLYRPDSVVARTARWLGLPVSPFPWFCLGEGI